MFYISSLTQHNPEAALEVQQVCDQCKFLGKKEQINWKV